MCFSFHLRLVIRVQKQEKAGWKAVGGPKEEKRVRGVSQREAGGKKWQEKVCHQAFLVCR